MLHQYDSLFQTKARRQSRLLEIWEDARSDRTFFVIVILIIAFAALGCSPLRAINDYWLLGAVPVPPSGEDVNSKQTILIITPTHARAERMADMTRLAQTLSLVQNLHWIVVEDANFTSPEVGALLERSGLPYVYFCARTEKGLPKRGWTHRNRAMDYIRENYANYSKGAVVYFADDDNAYDLRLFNNYIRNVRRLGLWAVAFSGLAKVEAPRVLNGTIVGWDVTYAPGRAFATDMAGFAINLKELLRVPSASFGLQCAKRAPENCFLVQFGIKKEEAEPFGWDDDPKEILVWHTKTGRKSSTDITLFQYP